MTRTHQEPPAEVPQEHTAEPPGTARPRRPFDLRHAIAALFGVYGVPLVLLGAGGASADDLRKTGGWNVNLWCGLAMLAFAALCAAWARWRPLSGPPRRRPGEPAADPSSRPTSVAAPAAHH